MKRFDNTPTQRYINLIHMAYVNIGKDTFRFLYYYGRAEEIYRSTPYAWYAQLSKDALRYSAACDEFFESLDIFAEN